MAKCALGAHSSDYAFGFTSYKDLQMRYEKNHLQWPNAERTFFDCHLSFFTGKSAMNAARVCKLRSGVKKTPQFLLFSMVKGGPSAQ
jgi:hypothetical protein